MHELQRETSRWTLPRNHKQLALIAYTVLGDIRAAAAKQKLHSNSSKRPTGIRRERLQAVYKGSPRVADSSRFVRHCVKLPELHTRGVSRVADLGLGVQNQRKRVGVHEQILLAVGPGRIRSLLQLALSYF